MRTSRPALTSPNPRSPLARGLAAAWLFDSPTNGFSDSNGGTRVLDRAGQHAAATAITSGTDPGVVPSIVGLPGYSNNNAAEYWSVAHDDGLNVLTGDATFSFRFLSTSIGTVQGGFGKRNGNDNTCPWNFWVISSMLSFSLGEGSSYSEAKSGTLVSDRWYHAAGVVRGTLTALYVDGVLVGTDTFSGTRQTNATAVRLGSYDAASYGLLGQYCHFKIWNRALTLAEIGLDYRDPWHAWRWPVSRRVGAAAAPPAESYYVIGGGCGGANSVIGA